MFLIFFVSNSREEKQKELLHDTLAQMDSELWLV